MTARPTAILRVPCAAAIVLIAAWAGCARRAEEPPKKRAVQPAGRAAAAAVPSSPRQLLDLAIEALGGQRAEEQLKLCRVSYRRWTAPPESPEAEDAAVVVEDCFEHPDRLRRTVRAEASGDVRGVFLVRGDRVQGQEVGLAAAGQGTEGPMAARPAVVSLILELMDARSDLARAVLTEPCNRDGRAAIGLTLRDQDGKPLRTLYFDLKTLLPVAEERLYMPAVAAPARQPERVVGTTTRYRNYERFDGVTLPREVAVYQGNQEVLETTLLKVEFLDGFPEGTFELGGAGGEKRPGEERLKHGARELRESDE